MASERGCLEHEKYLATVRPEVLLQRLQVFRLDPGVMSVSPVIACLSDIIRIQSPFTNYREYIHQLVPRTLDDLKNWFGVPNEIAKASQATLAASHYHRYSWSMAEGQCGGAMPGLPRALPMMRHYDFQSLDREQRIAVRQTGKYLLYCYIDPELASRPPLSGVIDYMLETAINARLIIFVAPDLIVCSHDVVEFKNVPVMLFNNILIYGNGRIVTKSNTQINAFQIRHVDV